jgi:FlaA1/EpsC-like NDP-sugar epimerase
VDDNPSIQGMRFDGLKVLGTIADIPALVKSQDVSVIFYAITKLSEADNQRILSTCRKTGLRVLMLSEVIETLNGYLANGNGIKQGTPAYMEPVTRPSRRK